MSSRRVGAGSDAATDPAHAFQGIAALVVAVAIWGGTFVVTKSVLDDVGPFTLLLLRFGLAWLCLVPFAYRHGFRMRLIADYVFFGVTGMVLHLGLETIGINYTSASNASLIAGGIPAATAALAVLLLGERLTLRRVAGIALAVAGVALISLEGNGTAPNAVLGNLLVSAGVVMWAYYTILGKRMASAGSPLLATTAATAIAALLLAPIAVIEVLFRGVPQLAPASIGSIAYLGVGASAVAFGLWNNALRYVDASVAGSFINLVPVIGVTLALIFLGEMLTTAQIAGGVVVATGVLLSAK